MPKACLRKQDSSQALQIWKSNALKTSGGRDPELVPAHTLLQAEAAGDGHVQIVEQLTHAKVVLRSGWAFSPTFIF